MMMMMVMMMRPIPRVPPHFRRRHRRRHGGRIRCAAIAGQQQQPAASQIAHRSHQAACLLLARLRTHLHQRTQPRIVRLQQAFETLAVRQHCGQRFVAEPDDAQPLAQLRFAGRRRTARQTFRQLGARQQQLGEHAHEFALERADLLLRQLRAGGACGAQTLQTVRRYVDHALDDVQAASQVGVLVVRIDGRVQRVGRRRRRRLCVVAASGWTAGIRLFM